MPCFGAALPQRCRPPAEQARLLHVAFRRSRSIASVGVRVVDRNCCQGPYFVCFARFSEQDIGLCSNVRKAQNAIMSQWRSTAVEASGGRPGVHNTRTYVLRVLSTRACSEALPHVCTIGPASFSRRAVWGLVAMLFSPRPDEVEGVCAASEFERTLGTCVSLALFSRRRVVLPSTYVEKAVLTGATVVHAIYEVATRARIHVSNEQQR